jgi:serine/threonine-protein kinase
MPSLVGQTLRNRYRVDDLIGRGGMAEVYKVWDEDRTTYLALKLLREDLAQDRIFLRRFKREAQTLAKLQHPNIVRFYGLEQDGMLAFMLMDFVEGSSLRAEIFQLDGKPMSTERIREIMRPVCSALNYAHKQGMVHCDAKPGNIMIDSSGKVLVTDFGIARMTDAATATMVGMGTPAYMAPELVRSHDPTPQTDIYALGVLLFEMLTGGERPFTGERAETTGSTSERVRWEQMNLEPPSPKQWNPDLSFQVEEVVLRCFEKEPTKRYASALDLLNALEKALVSKRIPMRVARAETLPPSAKSLPERSPEPEPVPEKEAAVRQVERAPFRRGVPPDRRIGRMLLSGLVAVLFMISALISVLVWMANNGVISSPRAEVSPATQSVVPRSTYIEATKQTPDLGVISSTSSEVDGMESIIESLEVALWPEFDKPAVLVIYQVQLSAGTILPAKVEMPIPARVGEPHAVAMRTRDGVLLVTDYARRVEGDWATITVETDNLEVWLEFYDDLAIVGQNRSHSFVWPGGGDIGEFAVEVQEPIGSSDFQVTPTGDVSMGEDGLTYHQIMLGPQSRTSTLSINLTYIK